MNRTVDQRPDLLRQVINGLDEATRGLALLEHDPRTAIDDAVEALDRARATLRLLGRSGRPDRPVLAEAWRLLQPLHALYVTGPATSPRPVPPPLAPSVRHTVTRVSVMLVGVRVRLADMTDPGPPSLDCPGVEHTVAGELDRSYRRARRRWRRLAADPSDQRRLRARRAVRRLSHQLEAVGVDDDRVWELVELGDGLSDHHDGVDPAGSHWFALTPEQQARWIRRELRGPAH